jgi:acid phosphatase type 7
MKSVASYACLFAIFAFLSACSDDDGGGLEPGASSPCTGTETDTSRLFLQQLSSSGVVIKWRGDADQVCVGSDASNLDTLLAATDSDSDHKEVSVADLNADTTYYYSVGGASTAPSGQSFRTAPTTGSVPADGNTRIWLVGDSGTGGDDEREEHEGEAAEVRDGMLQFVENTGGEPIDMFVMLGDNAYEIGSDFNYQQAVFETYPEQLANTFLVPTIGNHEMGAGELDLCFFVESIPCGVQVLELGGVSSDSSPDSWVAAIGDEPSRMPYLDIFSLPTSGESGGVPSGTEQYYSVDYGNVHVVSLDSQLSARDESQRATMREWLIDDLASNELDWTVVIFHHPPYSKGANHDSDGTEDNAFDRPIWDMRNEFVPIFDDYGVDVVYSGHSHSYERSYYLNNHTGTSDTYSNAEHAELIDGDPAQPALGFPDQPYSQLSPTSGGIDDRVVYTVAGNGGKADKDAGSVTDPAVWLRHAAHIQQAADTIEPKRNALAVIGSVVIDATADSLTANFVDVNGDVLDAFTITR